MAMWWATDPQWQQFALQQCAMGLAMQPTTAAGSAAVFNQGIQSSGPSKPKVVESPVAQQVPLPGRPQAKAAPKNAKNGLLVRLCSRVQEFDDELSAAEGGPASLRDFILRGRVHEAPAAAERKRSLVQVSDSEESQESQGRQRHDARRPSASPPSGTSPALGLAPSWHSDAFSHLRNFLDSGGWNCCMLERSAPFGSAIRERIQFSRYAAWQRLRSACSQEGVTARGWVCANSLKHGALVRLIAVELPAPDEVSQDKPSGGPTTSHLRESPLPLQAPADGEGLLALLCREDDAVAANGGTADGSVTETVPPPIGTAVRVRFLGPDTLAQRRHLREVSASCRVTLDAHRDPAWSPLALGRLLGGMESAQSGQERQEWPEGGAALALRTAPSHRAAAAEARSSRGHPSLALARELGIRRLHGSLVDLRTAQEAGSLSKSRGHRLSRHQGRAWADRRVREGLGMARSGDQKGALEWNNVARYEHQKHQKAFAESLDADKLEAHPVFMISKQACPFCKRAKTLLADLEAEFVSHELDALPGPAKAALQALQPLGREMTSFMGTVLGDYEIGGFLGRGQFASVNMAKHVKTGDTLAVKIINTSRMDPAKIQREIENQRGLRHPNIIQLMEVIESDGKVFVFMERSTGGDLFELIIARNRLQDKEARCYFRQIIDAVGFCHRNCVAHRDLKPENIFLDSNMNVKLGDFGLSSKFEWGIPLTESVGSPNYAAPEFSSSVKMLRQWLHASMPGYVSAEAKDVISKMLVIDREARASMADIRSHCWLKEEVKILVPSKQEVNEPADPTHSTLLAKMLLAMAEGTHPVSRKIRSCRSFGHVTAKRRASQCSTFGAVLEFVDGGWPTKHFVPRAVPHGVLRVIPSSKRWEHVFRGRKSNVMMYDAALELCPAHKEGLVARGAALTNLGRAREALRDFDAALQIDPENANALKYREIARKRGREELAVVAEDAKRRRANTR
eukprot:s1030_g18.t1